MSLTIISPVTESSAGSEPVDDFAKFLDEVLDSDSDDDVASRQSPKRRKVEVDSNGSCSISSSEVEKNGSLCEHVAGFYKEMCLICGERLDLIENVKSEVEELRVNNSQELRNSRTKELLERKKLHLVLDLDHTLLNSTAARYLAPEERYLLEKDHSIQGVFVVRNLQNPAMDLVTKLRPFVETFLKEASEMFEMSVYTMGDGHYARQMVKLLDPRNEYFGDRVVSRDDSTRAFEKNLDAVCVNENAVLVLDDTQQVWIDQNQDNVILMRRYLFFRDSYDSFGFRCHESHSELKTDESYEQPQGVYLAAILQLLKRIHGMFFDEEVALKENLVDRDVRLVLKTVRSRVLEGCKIAFSYGLASVSPSDWWNMAEKLGAVCSTEVMDPSVTHVISEYPRAVEKNKFLVHPQWIQASCSMWEKQPEDMFSLGETVPFL